MPGIIVIIIILLKRENGYTIYTEQLENAWIFTYAPIYVLLLRIVGIGTDSYIASFRSDNALQQGEVLSGE
jgi:hypothetical protein